MMGRSRETPRRESPDPGLRVEPGRGKTVSVYSPCASRSSGGESVSSRSPRYKKDAVAARAGRRAGGRAAGYQAATIHLKSLSDYSLFAAPSVIIATWVNT